jgi:ABC-2 type transport system permease protein
VSSAGTLTWFAQHECRLAWRDWLSMMTAGRRRRTRTVAVAIILFAIFMHVVAFGMVGRYAHVASEPDKLTLVVVTGSALLSWSLMLSQALESVTRAFYARADLDLILSSPIAARRLFAVRIAAMAFSTVAMALLMAAPFINALVIRGGWRWLGAYGVVAATGAAATALAVALTIALFHLIGAKRTRLVAQIVAAVIGAVFVIGLQAGAILSYGTLSRIAFLESDTVMALAPAADSLAWWPARAILGDIAALAAVLAAGALALAAAILLFAPRFAHHAIAAAGISGVGARQGRRLTHFRAASPTGTLRRKEWVLLRRDPWLLSQTLMQVLYLLPPALLLWRNFSGGSGSLVLLSPVLVMAAGQLAGGLAWLAISGEDAPDLIASAPVSPRQVLRAKIEAVMGGIALVFAPFVLALAFAAPFGALVSAVGIAIATASATAIQLWFRTQAKRSQFRRRQTSSRVATIAEAFSSIGWAATGALAAAGTWLALVPGLLTLAILAGARLISPAHNRR